MPAPRRIERLNDLFREETSKILEREIELPEDTLVTVTRVDISPDGHYATVFVSILGAEVQLAWKALGRSTPFLQKRLNRRIEIRPVPKIRFEIDREEFQREQVERSLSELKQKGEL